MSKEKPEIPRIEIKRILADTAYEMRTISEKVQSSNNQIQKTLEEFEENLPTTTEIATAMEILFCIKEEVAMDDLEKPDPKQAYETFKKLTGAIYGQYNSREECEKLEAKNKCF